MPVILPELNTKILSHNSSKTSKSSPIYNTATPFIFCSLSKLYIVYDEFISSPLTAYAVINNLGFKFISRPKITFCMLPPDNFLTE